MANGLGFAFTSQLFGRIGEAHQRRRLYRRTVAELQAMTPDELLDIGIRRGDIRRIAAEHVRMARG